MQEEWRAIEESDGMYEVSNTGKVRSLNYNKTGRVQELKQKIDRYGYCFEYGTLNDEEAKQVKKCVIDKLGAKKFNALLKRLKKKGVMPCQK